jgi:hypothetical protein
MGHKGPDLRPRCFGPGRAGTQIQFIHLYVVWLYFSKYRDIFYIDFNVCSFGCVTNVYIK